MPKFKLGVKNFRVFKEMTEFNIRPITILVGPNNSGKSSFTKLLLLLKNGFTKLNFDTGEHHLGSYEQSLNWEQYENNDETMIIRNIMNYPTLPDTFIEEVHYKRYVSGIYKYEITNTYKGNTLLEIVASYDFDTEYFKEAVLYFDINYIIDLFYNQKILVWCNILPPHSPSGLYFIERKSVSLDELREIELKEMPNEVGQINSFNIKGITLSNYKKNLQSPTTKEYLEKVHDNGQIIINSVLKNEIENLNKDYLLCSVFVDGEEFQDNSIIRKYQDDFFESSKINLNYDEPIRKSLKDIFNKFKKDIKKRFEERFYNQINKTDEVNIEVKSTVLGQLIFELYLFPSFVSNTSFFTTFNENIFLELNKYKQTEYIPANRGNQDRVLINKMNTKTYKETIEFEKNKRRLRVDGKYNSFLAEILSKIGIEGEIKIKRLENAVAIYIIKNGQEINLADFGFGYSQLIPIILQLFNLMVQQVYTPRYESMQQLDYELEGNYEAVKWNGKFIIIEEPEANLHPDLQSKLADIFSVVLKHNKNWHLIIETHSEYLIRKLQFLVASQKINKEDCIIHYFNDDANVSKKEPKVKHIEINEDGNLTENFGPGFYDESTKLQFELVCLNKINSN